MSNKLVFHLLSSISVVYQYQLASFIIIISSQIINCAEAARNELIQLIHLRALSLNGLDEHDLF